MWREQCFSSESAETECTNLFSGLLTTKSSDHKRANIFGSLRRCEMGWSIMSGRWESGCNVRGAAMGSQRRRHTDGCRKGQIPRFQAFASPCLPGGQKGCLRRLHFVRPFAPCFASAGDGQPVYLIDHEWLYQDPGFHLLSLALETRCFTPRKLWSDAVPESTDFGLEPSGTSQTAMSAKRGAFFDELRAPAAAPLPYPR